ncbi:MAG: glycoside hydrolase family 16 [Haloplasmataceae bacterium]|jgi:beta-glucanase (GH16 family)|nr:glycoside hydrolase family 16 [Haloplasmataceae bacterium]
MKKIITIIFIFTSILLVACSTTTNITTENTTNTSTTTNVTTAGTTAATTVNPNSSIYDVAPSLDMCNGIENIGDWEIAWCDEFNYRGVPDSKKWKYDTGGNGWGNNELQYYTSADRDNVFVEDDNLIITARKEKIGTNNYTSTRLNSSGRSEFLYGKIDIRAKLPGEKGTWPALWMLGNFGKYNWPGCGEVDIMEHVANDLNVVHGSIHTQNYYHKINTQKTGQMVLDDVVNEYHNYGIEWTPKQIRFFIDGINYFTFNNDEINNPDNSHDNWPFDEKMFFILNIAIGGWGGTVPSNFTEAKMFVDYVRVYQKPFEEIDTTSPSAIENIHTISNSPANSIIVWDSTNDNIGIKDYDIYLDDVFLGKTQVPSFTFKNLVVNQTYTVKIVASDFSSNTSLNTFTLTPQYPFIPGIVEAEDYIEMFGVQLENTSDVGGGQNIGYIDKNDYMIYKINVPTSGTYKIKYRIASQSLGGGVDLYNGDTLLVQKTFSGSGAWQKWMSVETEAFELDEGLQTIKLLVSKSGFNLNYFEFVKVE